LRERLARQLRDLSPRFGVGIDDPIEGGVGRARLLVAKSGREQPANDKRTVSIGLEGRLFINRWQTRMGGKSVCDTVACEQVSEIVAEHRAITPFHRVLGFTRQGSEKAFEAQQQLLSITQHSITQGRKLKQNHAESLAKSAQRWLDHRASRVISVEKHIGYPLEILGSTRALRQHQRRVGLDQKSKVGAGCGCHALQRLVIERRIETAIDTDTAQQGMHRIGSQPIAREFRLVVVTAVDDALPARKRPRRRTEAQTSRDLRSERAQFIAGVDGRNRGTPGRRVTEKIDLTAQASSASGAERDAEGLLVQARKFLATKTVVLRAVVGDFEGTHERSDAARGRPVEPALQTE